MNSVMAEFLEVTALCLAIRGYEAENPGCDPADAERYAAENVASYFEDALEWLVDRGERIMAEKGR